MFNFFKTARHWIVLTVAVALAAVACGQEQPSRPIEPAGPRPATSTTSTTSTTTTAAEVEVVEVPSATTTTTAAALAPVAVESTDDSVADTVEAPQDVEADRPETVDDDVVVMKTWIDETTTTTVEAPAHTTTTTTEPPATTTTVAAAMTTEPPAATATTAAPATTTTTTEPPATTTTVAAATTTTTTAAPATGGGAPPIPREGDPNVPEVNDGFDRPIRVDLSWFPEQKNVITWADWNRADESNTPEWARYEVEGICPPSRSWSYPLTIQLGTVLANAPRGADCFSSTAPQSYVVIRIYREPVCETEGERGCTPSKNPYAVRGIDRWFIVLCGYTFEGEWNDFGAAYTASAVRLDDGRFRVRTNNLFSPRGCDRV